MKTIILVTGASSGLGRETLFQLADRFGDIEEVWAVARRGERLAELSGQITAKLRSFPLDLAAPDSVKRLETALAEEKPQIRFLVNAAGVGTAGTVEAMDAAAEAAMLRINCMALCAVTRAALPYMAANSRIIQYASAAAFLPQPGFAVYAASKSFVLSYSRALNVELSGRGIRVTAVCPGPVDTEFLALAQGTGKTPLYKRLFRMKPEKVVRTAIRDSMSGRAVSVCGFPMKAFLLAAKLLPQEFLLKLIYGNCSGGAERSPHRP